MRNKDTFFMPKKVEIIISYDSFYISSLHLLCNKQKKIFNFFAYAITHYLLNFNLSR